MKKQMYTTVIGIYDATTMALLSEYEDFVVARCHKVAVMHAHNCARKFISCAKRQSLVETHHLTATQLNSLIEANEIDLLKNYVFKTHSVI